MVAALQNTMQQSRDSNPALAQTTGNVISSGVMCYWPVRGGSVIDTPFSDENILYLILAMKSLLIDILECEETSVKFL